MPDTIIRFGHFALDLRAGELYKKAIRMKLQEQPLRVLEVLVKNAGQVVLRSELQHEVWPDHTFVDFEHGLNKAINKLREALNDSPTSPRYIETITRRGYRFIAPVTMQGAELGRQTKIRVAVLPFQNLNRDRAQDYFSDGLTEELISYLGQTYPHEIGVIARTSVMAYRGTSKSTDEIGRELQVDYLLEGSVRKSQDRVRISAQLIACKDQTNRWAETYERPANDVFQIQREVGEQIARSLALELLPEQQHSSESLTLSANAHELYLLGRFLWNRRTETAMKAAIDRFEEALKLDPDFSLAYSGLANCYAMLCWYGVFSPSHGGEKAKAAASKAVLNGAHLGETHCALALVKFWYEWDFAGAESEFQKAIDIAPSFAEAYNFYGQLLNVIGRFDKAEAMHERARELDPFSVPIAKCAADSYFYRRQFDVVIQKLEALLQVEPFSYSAHYQLGRAYMFSGRYAQAIRSLEAAFKLSGYLGATPALGCAFALSGRTEEARRVLHEMKHSQHDRYASPTGIAKILLALGEHNEALDYLERAFHDHSFWMIFIAVDPIYDPVRRHPRFMRILKQMRLHTVATRSAA
jgi:TolB-like protein/Flp pilus assembly protein TadD